MDQPVARIVDDESHAPAQAREVAVRSLYPDEPEGPQATEYSDGYVATREVGGEERIFPSPERTRTPLFTAAAKIFQVHPGYGKGSLLATGTLHVMTPQQTEGAEEVSLVGECGETRFFFKWTDTCIKIAPAEYMLMADTDCVGIELQSSSPEATSKFDHLLRDRCIFRVEEDPDATLVPSDFQGDARRSLYPEDPTSQTVAKMTGWLCHAIMKASTGTANSIHSYGSKKTDAVTQSSGDISLGHAKRSESIRSATEKARKVITRISDKLSRHVGDKLVKHVEVKPGDSGLKAKARQLAASALLAYAEVTDSLVSGYTLVMDSTKQESQKYVEKRYGENAKITVGNSTAAVTNVGVSAITARRVLSVRKIVKSNAKYIAKRHAQNFVGKPTTATTRTV
mmetsp:Transcript_8189/g.24641  ORF Transcript_8189/g.24641 Transcript_8189/m.24641 type:complete len:398 (+) Transcript_8189:139-1332(+)